MIERQTLSLEVASQLRSEILSGALEPGERLPVTHLEERYGVSQIPIREALRLLQGEHLVRGEPGRVYEVASMSVSEMENLFDLRSVIEANVLSRLPSSPHSRLAELEDALSRLGTLTPSSEDPEWWAVHRRFHRLVLDPVMDSWSERLLEPVWAAVERYQRLYTLGFESEQLAAQEHEGLLDDVRSQDIEALVGHWKAHFEHAVETVKYSVERKDEQQAVALRES